MSWLFAVAARSASSDPVVEIAAPVVRRLHRYRQNRWWKREAGGQLFARIEGAHWSIVEATGPRKSDRRTRFGFVPDRTAEQAEIQDRFAKALHYVGDWHTHPEPRANPSEEDRTSMARMVAASSFQLPGLLMLIVGTEPTSDGLWLSLHRRGGWWRPLRLVEGSHDGRSPAQAAKRRFI
jgi:integrative and conjugative element protein (TIGR02256 family)